MHSKNIKRFTINHIFNVFPSIEQAGCASCFIDTTADFQAIRSRLIDFQTNIVLCDLKNMDSLRFDKDELRIAFKLTLFGTECALVQLNGIANSIQQADQKVNSNNIRPSKVLFYASTSGSCGDSKAIGVTYKCFMPNITSLG